MTGFESAARRFVVKVDEQTTASWSDIIERFADANIYQTWAYGAVRWGDRQLSHLTMSDGGEVLAAAQVRIIRVPLLPTGVAYVRWGPMCHLKDSLRDPVIAGCMLKCLKAEYCKRRGLVLLVIPNAYQESESGVEYGIAFKKLKFKPHLGLPLHRTLVVDLTPTTEVIRKHLDQKWRNQLNASEKMTLELEVRHDSSAYQEFQQLYQVMHDTKQFSTNVDVGEFGHIQEQLREHDKLEIFLVKKDGEFVAALVCAQIGESAIYLLGATTVLGRKVKASYYLHWQAMMWLKERGAKYYDLGGIDPDTNPGGYHFKSGFGGSDVTKIPAFFASSGMLSEVLNCGITWMQQIRQRI